MAKDMSMGRLISLILGAVLVVIILFSLFYFNALGKLGDIFPFFEKGNVTVEWEEEYFLDYPEEMVIRYDDGEHSGDVGWGGLGDFNYRYREEEGWQWLYIGKSLIGNVVSRHWLNIESDFKREEIYSEVKKEDKEFMESLNGKSPEKGLKMLVERTINNPGSLFYNPRLWVGFGCNDNAILCCNSKIYKQKDKELRDLDAMIHRFNRAINGCINEGKIKVEEKGEVENEG